MTEQPTKDAIPDAVVVVGPRPTTSDPAKALAT